MAEVAVPLSLVLGLVAGFMLALVLAYRRGFRDGAIKAFEAAASILIVRADP
ncbi:hypothetical protein [Prosthecomicrobium hirschii]|uniref:hypothetical protein n=1 Tax=Prosthecodimorpha hirschii TaxID=665126 RepID=UPI00221F723E|nr:hypothetical protein [Prosthecomicrobium hirschii]MCW1844168.1 hypothetical protein [Prosthecomicrobium hirschii]